MTLGSAAAKAETCMNWMAHGPIFVHFDSTRLDVRVPNWIRSVKTTLIFGFDLAVPICDLCVNQHSISGTLSFERTPQWCDIPWSAVYKIRSDALGAVRAWVDDVPAKLQGELIAEVDKRKQTEKMLTLKSQLRVIKGGAS